MDFLQFLPKDIVFNHVIKCLDFTSRVRAASVSRLWRDILRAAPPFPDLPWLWFTRQSMNDDFASTPICNSFLIDLASFTTTPSCISPSPFYRIIGSRVPYLTISTTPSNYFISSPFTNENIQLPCTYLDRDAVRSTMPPRANIQFLSIPPNCVVAAWEQRSTTVYLIQPGDENWVAWLGLSDHIGDMIFHKGQLYCVEGTDIIAYNIKDIFNYEKKRCNSSHPESRTPVAQSQGRKIATGAHVLKSSYSTIYGTPGRYGTLLVESGEELLVVVMSSRGTKRKQVTFTVHRIDEDKGELVQVTDLGDRMLFVGDGCSVMSGFGMGLTIKTDSFFTKNSIYFFSYVPLPGQHWYNLAKFKLDSNTCYLYPGYGFQNPHWVVSPHQNR